MGGINFQLINKFNIVPYLLNAELVHLEEESLRRELWRIL